MFAELASIVNCCLSKFDATVYIGDLPETTVIPSLYFPPPSIVDAPGTTATYQKQYTLTIKLIHQDNLQAYQAAEAIAEGIRSPRYLIPILTEDSQPTGEFLRIEHLEMEMTQTGTAQLTLKWRRSYDYHQETYSKIAKFTLTEKVKENDAAKTT